MSNELYKPYPIFAAYNVNSCFLAKKYRSDENLWFYFIFVILFAKFYCKVAVILRISKFSDEMMNKTHELVKRPGRL